MVKFIITFFIVQLVNVMLNTFKTIFTVKASRGVASFINAITYGFYTIVVVLTANDFNIWVKVAITIITNLIGVYFSMWLLDKLRKEKLWEIVATIDNEQDSKIIEENIQHISHNVIKSINGEYIYHIYAKKQKESEIVKKELQKVNAHYMVHEESVKL